MIVSLDTQRGQQKIEGTVIINKHPIIFTLLILFVFSFFFFLLLGDDSNRIDAATLSAIVGILVAGIIGLKTIRNAPKRSKLITHIFLISDDSDRDPTGTPAYGLDYLLLLYSWATLFTLAASMAVTVGKLWVTIGVLHNVSEIFILVLLGNGGRITSSSFLGWILIYAVSVVVFCNLANLPGDALFFKFQGLIAHFVMFYFNIYRLICVFV